MSSERLADLLGGIDEKYILETMHVKRKNSHRFMIIAAAAASFLLVAGSTYYFDFKPQISEPGSTVEVAETGNTTQYDVTDISSSVSSDYVLPISDSVLSVIFTAEKEEQISESYISSEKTQENRHPTSVKDTPDSSVTQFEDHTVTLPVTDITERVTEGQISFDTTAIPAESDTVTETVTEENNYETTFPPVHPDTAIFYDHLIYNEKKYYNAGQYYIPKSRKGQKIIAEYKNNINGSSESIAAYTCNGIDSDKIIIYGTDYSDWYDVFINTEISSAEADGIKKEINDF